MRSATGSGTEGGSVPISDLLHLRTSDVLCRVGATARREGDAVGVYCRDKRLGAWMSEGGQFEFTDGSTAADVYDVVVATVRIVRQNFD